jgi:hypothetical protein
MWKQLLIGILGFASLQAGANDGLTDVERRWIEAGRPVVSYAKRLKLPLDIVVQPDVRPGVAPLAMGFVEGRCKLVLTMRGNPQAEAVVQGVEADLLPAIIEAMTAHELGHCWRYVGGAWHTLPAGFVDAAETPDDDRELVIKRRDMRQARREEGFADLVGLAWTLAQYPQHYARVYAWFEQVRDDHPGEHHDTRAWLRLVRDPAVIPAAATPFDQVRGLWRQGLFSAD